MCWESQAVVEVYNSNHFVIRCKSPFHGKRILNSALKNRHICYRSDFRHPKTYDSNNFTTRCCVDMVKPLLGNTGIEKVGQILLHYDLT